MIQKQQTVPTIMSDGLEATVMGINAAKLGMITRILRDSIYSDKIMATLRETTINALDEHVKYQIDRPVEMGIRNENNSNVFFVRDYAKGLSEYDIRNVFGMYLESTKTHTNSQVGGFGIGACAPLSYTDTFYIVSHFEGTKTTYVATLDAGEGGESISKILKISEESTDETGIEISAEIKKGDAYKFDQKIKDFIRYCDMPIIGHGLTETYTPDIPSQTIQKDGYTFKVFQDGHKNVIYRMGNITYKVESDSDLISQTNLIIEIPIGNMTIPVSREAFEDTRSNQRTLDIIKNHIQHLKDEDLAKFKALTIDELIKDKDTDYFVGDIFKCEKKKLFPSEIPIISNLQKTLFGENTPDFEKLDGKTIVGIIPNNKAKDMWRDRMIHHSKGQNKQWFTIVDSPHLVEDRLPESIKNYFVFKKVKSKFFGLRKLDANEKRTGYIVGEQRNGGTYSIHKDEYTPLELHNHVRSMLKLEEAEDLEEAKLQMEEQIFDSYKTLGLFTISSSSNGSRCPYWWSASQKMRDSMYAIGWMQPDDDKHDKILKELRDEEDRRLKEKELIENCYPRFLDCGLVEKRRNLAQSKIRYAKKVKKIFDNIQTENSLRSKITKMYSYNYYAPKLTRHEFRKILKLTNEPVGV